MSRPPKDAVEIAVVGKQWMWKLQHPDGQREINELHVPVGRPVRLTMASEDVIHSFYIPAFRMKKDVLPGRYSIAWFEATRPGRYHIFCAEYCGTKHSGMIGSVEVMEPVAFQNWLAGGAASESLAVRRLEALPAARLQHLPPAGLSGTGAQPRESVREPRPAGRRPHGRGR